MGVYIKGMKMPENCSECVISRLGKCGVSGKEIVLWQTNRKGDRPPNCPLIHVPPHGRLIDADALIKGHFSDEHRIAMSYADKCWMQRIINGEPTIIPAEEDTDG